MALRREAVPRNEITIVRCDQPISTCANNSIDPQFAKVIQHCA